MSAIADDLDILVRYHLSDLSAFREAFGQLADTDGMLPCQVADFARFYLVTAFRQDVLKMLPKSSFMDSTSMSAIGHRLRCNAMKELRRVRNGTLADLDAFLDRIAIKDRTLRSMMMSHYRGLANRRSRMVVPILARAIREFEGVGLSTELIGLILEKIVM